MKHWRHGLIAIAVAVGAACASQADGEQDPAGGGGKEDNPQDHVDPNLCDLDQDADRRVVRVVVNDDHVQLRCVGPGDQDVEIGCCYDQLGEFWFATGCPLQATFARVEDSTDQSGARQRCIADEPTASDEEVTDIELVATSCCAPLCDNATWDDPATKENCRGESGQFQPHTCCEMSDTVACGDATWDGRAVDEGEPRCWAQSGAFADHYAVDACCIDQCFGDNAYESEIGPVSNLPIGCRLPADNECAGATVNATGACALDLTESQREAVGEHLGAWAKAMCCAGQAGLDIDLADDCYRRDLVGDDLSSCG